MLPLSAAVLAVQQSSATTPMTFKTFANKELTCSTNDDGAQPLVKTTFTILQDECTEVPQVGGDSVYVKMTCAGSTFVDYHFEGFNKAGCSAADSVFPEEKVTVGSADCANILPMQLALAAPGPATTACASGVSDAALDVVTYSNVDPVCLDALGNEIATVEGACKVASSAPAPDFAMKASCPTVVDAANQIMIETFGGAAGTCEDADSRGAKAFTVGTCVVAVPKQLAVKVSEESCVDVTASPDATTESPEDTDSPDTSGVMSAVVGPFRLLCGLVWLLK